MAGNNLRMLRRTLLVLAATAGCPKENGYPCQHVECRRDEDGRGIRSSAECWCWISEMDRQPWRVKQAGTEET